MNKENTIETSLKVIRAIFPNNVYVGGSYARRLCLGDIYDYDDVDIFVVGPRKMEMWVIAEVLKNHFDEVDFSTVRYYFIPAQFSRIVLRKDGIKFDLILVNSNIDDVINQTASTYSKFYYKVTYGDNMLSIHNHPQTVQALTDIMINKVCHIRTLKSTASHQRKIQELCDRYNIRYNEK